MEACIAQLSVGRQAETLEIAISSRGAFRRLRSLSDDLIGLDQWYQFEEQAYQNMAVIWCDGMMWLKNKPNFFKMGCLKSVIYRSSY
ncbi:hypothetical protein [Lactiplantibacillus paraplantarum]|uniref:hypothetical protein n=1 Tax=Lactiplantibacillus paraplantarum TaxID=60520 RepID=UPI0023AAA064|nr:hypothetical protein [Lactiplantibacillus paraplantarum]WEE36884.1 hypothetical protein PWO93_04610 [Lactiplantibacillus paraplantarum]